MAWSVATLMTEGTLAGLYMAGIKIIKAGTMTAGKTKNSNCTVLIHRSWDTREEERPLAPVTKHVEVVLEVLGRHIKFYFFYFSPMKADQGMGVQVRHFDRNRGKWSLLFDYAAPYTKDLIGYSQSEVENIIRLLDGP